ncbi:DUF1931 family protein [Desulfolithobacter sp.]
MGAKQIQKLFSKASGLDVDKSDIKRLGDFICARLRDLLVLGQVSASVNGRDIIDYHDVPITAGLQLAIREFRELDEELALSAILEQLTALPPLRMSVSDMLEQKLPELVGGITISLARVFKVLDPELKNPGTREWEQVEEIYRILL